MNYQDFRTKMQEFVIFSADDARRVFPHFHRQRLYEWMKKGYVKKVAKSHYIFSDTAIDEKVLFLLSNIAYTPSYVSLESALAYYGLIPEGVYTVTAISSKTTRSMISVLAPLRYRHLKQELFWGYRLEKILHRSFAIAQPEKALADFLHLNTHLKSKDDFFELRINADIFRDSVDTKKLRDYVERFGSKALVERLELLLSVLVYI